MRTSVVRGASRSTGPTGYDSPFADRDCSDTAGRPARSPGAGGSSDAPPPIAREPESSVACLNDARQWAQLPRGPWHALAYSQMLTVDEVVRILQCLGDFGTPDVKDPGSPIYPRIPVSGRRDSGDAGEPVFIDRLDAAKTACAILLQPPFPAYPDPGSPPIERRDVADAGTLFGGEESYPVATQHGKAIVRAPEPHAAEAIREFNDDIVLR